MGPWVVGGPYMVRARDVSTMTIFVCQWLTVPSNIVL